MNFNLEFVPAAEQDIERPSMQRSRSRSTRHRGQNRIGCENWASGRLIFLAASRGDLLYLSPMPATRLCAPTVTSVTVTALNRSPGGGPEPQPGRRDQFQGPCLTGHPAHRRAAALPFPKKQYSCMYDTAEHFISLQLVVKKWTAQKHRFIIIKKRVNFRLNFPEPQHLPRNS